MGPDVRSYLQHVRDDLHLQPAQEHSILLELQGHLEERVHELQEDGLPYDQALDKALGELGDPRLIAQQLYAVHTKASWHEAALAAVPHLLFAILFVFHLWTIFSWVVLFIIGTALVSVQAWRRGYPRWIYPWLGYSLVGPIVIWFLALIAIATGIFGFLAHVRSALALLSLLGALMYLPLGGWLIWKLFSPVVRRDWVMASLTLLPLPFLGSWLLLLWSSGGPFAYNSQTMLGADRVASLVFLCLAGTSVVFFKLGHRSMRGFLLMLATPILVILGMTGFGENPASLGVFLFSILSVGLLLTPALLESRLGHERHGSRGPGLFH
ncbi:MAG: hypothetical protein HYU29_08380 [Chloroflexi bacterium]|nr:hypothetical protein [Chloroflexota bacterium]